MTDLRETAPLSSSVVPRFASGIVEQPETYLHQWLYSVVPVGIEGSFSAYLTGFCKNCRNVFSQLIPVDDDGGILITKTDVPKEGCVSPLAGY